MATQKEDTTWKQKVETEMGRVQQAGNALEERVGKMGEDAVLIRMNQAEKIKTLTAQKREMEKEIT
jgi:chromosome segregation ATPase